MGPRIIAWNYYESGEATCRECGRDGDGKEQDWWHREPYTKNDFPKDATVRCEQCGQTILRNGKIQKVDWEISEASHRVEVPNPPDDCQPADPQEIILIGESGERIHFWP